MDDSLMKLTPSAEARRLIADLLYQASLDDDGNPRLLVSDDLKTKQEDLSAYVAGLEAEVARLRPAPIPDDRRAVLECTVALPTPDMLRARLLADGWLEEETFDPDLDAFVLGKAELILPRGDAIPDGMQGAIVQGLRCLSDRDGEGRPAGDIAAEIVAQHAALVRPGAEP